MIKNDDLKRVNAALGYCHLRIRGKTLQLRCRRGDVRFERSVCPATKEGLQAALAIAKQIEADMYRGQFDATLVKYGLASSTTEEANESVPVQIQFTLKDAWENYKNLKGKTAAVSTKHSKWSCVDRFINLAPPHLLEIHRAGEFLLNFQGRYSDGTISGNITTLSSAVQMSIDMGLYDGKNPFPKLKKLFATPPKEIKSFTKADVAVILNAFATNTKIHPCAEYKSSYYLGFVTFRFLTGCRPSEAVALTWDDIKVDSSGKRRISINKRYVVNSLVQGTKNGVRERILPCGKQLQELLDSIPRGSNSLVFPAPKGGHIDATNFGQRWWRPIVKDLYESEKISCYMPFYDIRHTFGTHAIRSGVDIKSLSSFMGNSPEVLLSHYVEADTNIITPEYDL